MSAKKTSKKKGGKKPSKKSGKKPSKMGGKKPAKKGGKKPAKKAPAKKPAKAAPAKKAKPKKLSNEEMQNKFFQWKLDGFNVDKLGDAMGSAKAQDMVRDYEVRITRLIKIQNEVDNWRDEAHKKRLTDLKKKLKDPEMLDEIEKEYSDLRSRLTEKIFTSFKVVPIEVDDDEDEYEDEEEEEEEGAPSEKKHKLEKGMCYLLREDKPDKSYKLFAGLVKAGSKGVCVTREFPKKIRTKYGLDDARIFWLSNTEEPDSFKPVELGKLYYNLEEFLKKEKDTAIMLSGLEYLITQNNYSSVLKLIQLLNEQIALRDSILIIPLSPGALDAKDLKLIERELKVLD